MKNISLVISCGGAKGLVGIGVIEELERNGFIIKSVSGTSIGSVILGVYASGKLNEFKQWMLGLSRLDVFRLMDFTINKQGILKGKKIFDEMNFFFKDSLIENLPIPYSAVSADIKSFKEVVFNKGSLHHAIRCSISVPSLLTPVIYKKMVLVDGGILNPLPLSRVKRTKDDILVAVNLNYMDPNYKNDISPSSLDYPIMQKMLNYFSNNKKEDNGNVMNYLNKTVYIMMSQLSKNSIELNKPDILINIPYNVCGFFDYHKTSELIRFGVEKTKLALKNYEDNIA
ncbi:MAG: patatin [Flavobacteriales bacterium]|nr:patatin [Flavobacteriales bacterium]|tara:strand:+ start:236 stop:1090 length:855 start_codon:yes stop_codon:yes gene_type:complete